MYLTTLDITDARVCDFLSFITELFDIFEERKNILIF